MDKTFAVTLIAVAGCAARTPVEQVTLPAAAPTATTTRVLPAATPPLFEGTIEMYESEHEGQGRVLTYEIRDPKLRLDLPSNVVLLFDRTTHVAVYLKPESGVALVRNLSHVSPPKRVWSHEIDERLQIAGSKCERWESDEKDKRPQLIELCILPGVVFITPELTLDYGAAGFPLRLVAYGGGMEFHMQANRIDPHPIDASRFEIPPDYKLTDTP